MRRWSRRVLVWVAGGAVGVAGLAIAGGAIASSVVILNPAEMKGSVSFSAETLMSYEVRVNSTDGLYTYGTYTTSPYSLTVENGHQYRPSIEAYFSNPSASQSYLKISRSSPVLVDNQNGPTTVNFSYPGTSRVNFTINVTGGTIKGYYVYASANAPSESYDATTFHWFSSATTSATSWDAMVADDAVNMYGTVYLTAADGTQLTRSLSQQTVNLLQGQASVSWPIDLTLKGTLGGSVALSPSGDISSRTLYFQGVSSTPAYGYNGSKQIVNNGSYTLDLAPGQYDVYLRSNYPNRYADTKSYRVTVTAGATTTQDFVDTLATVYAPLNVSGFYTNTSLSWSQLRLTRQDPSPGLPTSAEDQLLTNGQFEYLLPSGGWKRYLLVLGLSNTSDPDLPLAEQYQRYHYTDTSTTMIAPGAVASLGAEEVMLVKSNAYFKTTDASLLLSKPYVEANRTKYDNNIQQSYTWFRADGSATPKTTTALTMVAEPGTYTMRAYATVNGSVTQLSIQPVTFGEPAVTAPSPDPANPQVSVQPIDSTPLTVTLDFPQVTSPGVTTVVETPFGPEPPEGFKSFCLDGNVAQEIGCSSIYYDIKTTAVFPDDQSDPAVKVCVRRQVVGQTPADFLVLGHYDEAKNMWEVLETPPDMVMPARNCIDDLAACGCADEQSCGIDYTTDPDNPMFAYLVCGMTRSFSPFTVLKSSIRFTNTVNGVSYEGPNGPPTLQTWTVPEAGVYRITATGARGAAASLAQGIAGGCGAKISGEFAMNAGDLVKVLVGQKGTATPYSGGGGGGTFVMSGSTPLVIAGGGGGVRSGALVNGRHGSVGTAGGNGSASSNYTSGFIAGGTNGMGGSRLSTYGSGGGGWIANGASDGSYGEGGMAISGLLAGRGGLGKSCGGLAHGGYGGGGAGNGCYGGGGGGGYSGGGGGRVAGGGGSFNAGANTEGSEGACTPSGHGIVTIEHLHQ